MEGTEDRKHLWAYNRCAVQMALAKVPDLGKEPMKPMKHMVLVVDTRDSLGGVILLALDQTHPHAGAVQEMAKIAARGEIPTLVTVLPVAGVCEIISKVNPAVKRSLETFPLLEGCIWALVIGGEGAMLLQTPLTGAPAVGEA